jgi:ABC-type uncharacterized transport system fused permease/ATPase subunit
MIRQSYQLFRRALAHEKSNKTNLLITVVLEIFSVVLLYFLNRFYGTIYDGISHYNSGQIYGGMAKFAGLAGALVLVGGLTTFYCNKLAFSIREGLNIYYLQRINTLYLVDNREQRIQEDLKNFGERSCEFWFAVFRSILKIPIFLGVIITLTQWYVGLIVIAAVIIGTFAVKCAANSLISQQAKQESNEATYRKEIITGFFTKFQEIKTLFNIINIKIKRLSYLQSGLGQAFVLLPFVILLPLYLSKSITMGVLMQAANALGKVIESLTVLIEQRQLIVNISTCLLRMETLDVKVYKITEEGRVEEDSEFSEDFG